MLKKIILTAMLGSTIAACNSKAKSARDYNNEIIRKEKSLQPAVETTENNVKKYYEAGRYDSIASAGERMENIVQKTIDEINTMTVPGAKGADQFKTAVIIYFKFIKRLYTDYKEFGKAATDAERQLVSLDIQKIVSQKTDAINDLQNAQRKFAEANGFRLETKTN